MGMEEKKDVFENIKIINALNKENAHISALNETKSIIKGISKKINDKARLLATAKKEEKVKQEVEETIEVAVETPIAQEETQPAQEYKIISDDSPYNIKDTIEYSGGLESSYLNENETVDHIDENKTNDSIENLQILSRKDNVKKHVESVKKPFEHGTYRMYHVGKCRCLLCKKAKRESMNKYYEKHRDEVNQRRRQKRKDNSSV